MSGFWTTWEAGSGDWIGEECVDGMADCADVVRSFIKARV